MHTTASYCPSLRLASDTFKQDETTQERRVDDDDGLVSLWWLKIVCVIARQTVSFACHSDRGFLITLLVFTPRKSCWAHFSGASSLLYEGRKGGVAIPNDLLSNWHVLNGSDDIGCYVVVESRECLLNMFPSPYKVISR